jgi:hypothetical protein
MELVITILAWFTASSMLFGTILTVGVVAVWIVRLQDAQPVLDGHISI